MVMADKEFNLQEYISMGFYCLVGTGVIVHWIHVWLGKPDYRVRQLEARLRSLEEGDRIRDKFALASLGGYPQSVSSSRRGSTTACNTVNGNNSIFAGCNESLFQATPSKRLRADSYFTAQPLENVSPHDCSPPPFVFPKPPPASRPSQPASPVSPTAGPPGQALSFPETPHKNGGNGSTAHVLQGSFPLSKSTNDVLDARMSAVRRRSDASANILTSTTNNNNNPQQQQNLVLDTAAATQLSPGGGGLRPPLSPPSRPLSRNNTNNSRATSRSRSHSSFRSHSHQRHHGGHQPHRYGFHYPHLPHLPHLPPVNSGAENRVGHIAGMVGPGPLSD
ncbi:hypothetical protein IWZ01DRAFT_480871 [Phyllosticta capitalensis]